MAYYPEFEEIFTNDMKNMIEGNRVYIGDVSKLPKFHSGLPIGTYARWGNDRVVMRKSDITWTFMNIEKKE